MSAFTVTKIKKVFTPDPQRVIIKVHIPVERERTEKIITRVLNLSHKKAKQVLTSVMEDFSQRHKNFLGTLDEHYNIIKKYIPDNIQISDTKRLLLGAYFSLEYSVQAAAFFNPSMVEHPDQSDLPKGSIRFIMSFRSVGEGHISSIEFRSGIINAKGEFTFEAVSPYVERATTVSNPVYDKKLFVFKMIELDVHSDFSELVGNKLQEQFSLAELQAVLSIVADKSTTDDAETILWLAKSNYSLHFKLDQKLSERILFPCSLNDSNGIEDARFVRFVDDNGSITYYATYTAYNGFKIMPQILVTKDFLDFQIVTLNGQFAGNKGMALFPHKINGKYMMISRFDGENLYLMSSENIYYWPDVALLKEPEYDWEFFQIGNCGSPIETNKGWIVLTHGVGPMRRYCIGAMLLDLQDPSIVIGSTASPLLSPAEEEREGYVPNVVYSCGAMIHGDVLVLPYAMSDTSSGIVTVPVEQLLHAMIKNKAV